MKPYLIIGLALLQIQSYGQYRNDNVAFKTVYPQDLCKSVEKDKGALFLDVRSKGEFEDTSASSGLNIGAFRHAVNINVRELGSRISEISEYKNKPVYVYCSHSQRSRRASKMLADSGFTNIININGGVTAIRQLPLDDCAQGMLIGKSGYRIMSLATLCDKLESGNGKFMVIDVRTDSAYQHISRDAKGNAYGHFKSARHISLDSLKKGLPSIPYDTEIVLVDLYGDEAAKAALLFNEKYYKNVSVLIEGMDRVYASDLDNNKCAARQLVPAVQYPIVGILNFQKFIEKNPDYVLVDLRTADEFNGRHKDAFRNIGQLKNAINIPAANLNDSLARLEPYKAKNLVLYGFGGNREVFESARFLESKGYKPVILNGGIFNLRWTAANVKGYKYLANMVINIPAENL